MSEIVLVIGYNAAGKTTHTKKYLDAGYFRINRDEIGGKLKNLHEHAAKALDEGKENLVLDNTYRDVASRKSIIDLAKSRGINIRCVWVKTSFEDAQFNACQRMVRDTGKLLMPADFAMSKNPNHFPPAALFSYRKDFEKPTKAEGFSEIETVNFVRKYDSAYKNKALILDYDGTLRDSSGDMDYPVTPDEVVLLDNCKEKLQEYFDQGYLLLGVSNQSGVAKGVLTYDDAVACFERTNELLGFDIEYHFCPHSVPPVKCYCRKPHAGLGAYLIEVHKLDPLQCIFVGDQTTDKTFAMGCGFQYQHPNSFFDR